MGRGYDCDALTESKRKTPDTGDGGCSFVGLRRSDYSAVSVEAYIKNRLAVARAGQYSIRK